MSSSDAPPSMNSTFGCFFLSAIFTSILWGVGCLQLYLYYEKYSKTDKIWLKTYAFLIWALDTAHEVIIVVYVYTSFVTEFGNTQYLNHLPPTLINTTILAAIIDAMVQVLFVVRAWHLSFENRLLAGILSAFVLAQVALTLVYFGKMYTATQISQLVEIVNSERLMNIAVCITDSLIALTLVYLLWNRRSGFKKTDSVIQRLVMYTIGTGLVTALLAIVAFILAEALPQSFYYVLIDLNLPKLYFNCMLASLNARKKLRGDLAGDEKGVSIHSGDYPSSGSTGSIEFNHSTRKASNSEAIECRIDIDTTRASDNKHEFSTGRTSTSRASMA